MGWLDAHEYMLIEAVSRDRAEDARAMAAVALVKADDCPETTAEVTDEPAGTDWCPLHVAWHGVHSTC